MAGKARSIIVDKAIERLDRIDQTQIESLLRSLHGERDFLQGVFDRLTEGALVLDASWNVEWTNRAARRLLGLEHERRLVGASVFDLPLDDELLGVLRRFSLSPTRTLREEIVISKPTDRFVALTLVPPEQADDEHGCVAIVEDLTERRLEQARRQEAEKLASLATLTSGIAHEIKNPLNSLQIHAQLLERMVKEGAETDQARERVLRSTEIIQEEITRLGGVVEEFLAAARPTRPELLSRRLNPIIERLAGVVRPELDEKNIELALDLEDDLIELHVDERQMIQALMNLVRNAVEAIETKREGDPTAEGRIEIRSRCDQQFVWIMITDTGCGIAEENRERLLEPYFTTKFSGTGLGLMVVYRIVKEHGGTLTVQSEVDLGATVTIGLPLHHRAPRTLSMNSEETASREEQEPV